MIAQPDPLTVLARVAHASPYARTKAERRRQRRGMKFPALHGMICGLNLERHSRVVVFLLDGTRWRVFMRGGKSFRRKLAA